MSSVLSVQSGTDAHGALALIDIDLFKRVNDSYGHAGGDEVLRRFARSARAVMRSGDVLARWGGEEFLLMLPGASTDDAYKCMQRFREALQQTSFDDISPGMRVTFSAGVAACDNFAQAQAAIEAADQAMYRAKMQGRDCTVIEGEAVAAAAPVAGKEALCESQGERTASPVPYPA